MMYTAIAPMRTRISGRAYKHFFCTARFFGAVII